MNFISDTLLRMTKLLIFLKRTSSQRVTIRTTVWFQSALHRMCISISKILGLNRLNSSLRVSLYVKQALYTQSGCHELFQVLQQVIAYLRRQAGLASRTCLSWDYQFYCSRLCRRECIGSKFFSLSFLSSLPAAASFSAPKRKCPFPVLCTSRPTIGAIFQPLLSLLHPKKIAPALLTTFLLSLFPIETEKTVGRKERHCRSFSRWENSSSFVLHSRALHFVPSNMRPVE